MTVRIIWFLGGIFASSLTVFYILLLIQAGQGERGSGRAKVELKEPTQNLIVAAAGQNDQAPERPPEKGNGRKDH